MLSHDIRNPLNAVMGVVQLLDRSDLAEPQRRFVRLLKSSSENMLNLLNHVLELSKAESSSFALVETPFSVRSLVDDVVSTFERGRARRGLEMRSSGRRRRAAVADRRSGGDPADSDQSGRQRGEVHHRGSVTRDGCARRNSAPTP